MTKPCEDPARQVVATPIDLDAAAPSTIMLEIALDYIERGWSLTHIRLKEKAPKQTGWQKLQISEADAPKYFANRCNIGALLGTPSHGLTDIDLDCPEAVIAARLFLPPTGAIFGRQSNPTSHHLFYTDLGATGEKAVVKVEDPTLRGGKATIAELRTGGTFLYDDPKKGHKAGDYNGLQTVMPGSVHPSGEIIRWEKGSDGMPARVGGDELSRAFWKLSAIALVLRYFPSAKDPSEADHIHGSNDAAGATAGVLAREGMTDDEIDRVMEAICGHIGANHKDRANITDAARRMVRDLRQGKPALGQPRLVEIMSEKVVEKIVAFLTNARMSEPVEQHVARFVEKQQHESATTRPTERGEASGRADVGGGSAERTDGAHDAKGEPLVLDRNDPNPSARMLMARKFVRDDQRTLLHYRGVFYEWDGARYEAMEDPNTIKGVVWEFLDGALCRVKGGVERFKSTPERVAAVTQALLTQSQSRKAREFPHWSHKATAELASIPAEEMLACSNGLLHIPTRKMFPHTPTFRNTFAVDYAFDPEAPTPALWLKFMRELWPNDDESVETLQEMFGLLLTNDTSHQKAFMIVGPPRSGKGTLARVLQRLVGKDNYAATTLSSLGGEFGKQPLLNKTLSVMSDVRIDGRTDLQSVTETLLSISGEDAVPVNRKNRDVVIERLKVRFLLLTNAIPRLPDSSEALAKRFVMLQLFETFLGREDKDLTDRLTCDANMPGLLNWALDGLARLKKRGYFGQPKTGMHAKEMLAAASNPVGEFVEDCCEVGAGRECTCADLFNLFKIWSSDQGAKSAGTVQALGTALHAKFPRIGTKQGPRSEGRGRRFVGINLSVDGRKRLVAYEEAKAKAEAPAEVAKPKATKAKPKATKAKPKATKAKPKATKAKPTPLEF
jgi:putative DNA primase/helicase